MARRENLLQDIQKDLPTKSYIQVCDVANTANAMKNLEHLIKEMWGVDAIVINAWVGFMDEKHNREKELQTVKVNVEWFVAMSHVAIKYFTEKGTWHIVGVSSIAWTRWMEGSPCYSWSKAFVSNYLEWVRKDFYLQKLPVTVTDIRPGRVYTALAKGGKMFRVATPEVAAKQIFQAISKKNDVAYVTKRRWILAAILKIVPRCLYKRISL